MKKSMMLDYVCRELEDLENNLKKQGGLTPSDMQKVDMLSRIQKNLLKAEEMTGSGDEESMRSMRSMRSSYDDGSNRSYEGAMRPVSERDGYSERNRDRMGRYSRADGGYSGHSSEELLDAIEKMLQHRED